MVISIRFNLKISYSDILILIKNVTVITKNIAIIGMGAVGSFLVNFILKEDISLTLIERDLVRYNQICGFGVNLIYDSNKNQIKSCFKPSSFKLHKDPNDLINVTQDLVIIATKEYDINPSLITKINQITNKDSIVLFVQTAVEESSYRDLKAIPLQMIINAGLDFDQNNFVKLKQDLSNIQKNGFPVGKLRVNDSADIFRLKEFFDDSLPLEFGLDFEKALYKKFMVAYGYGLPGVVEEFLKANISNYESRLDNSSLSYALIADLKKVTDSKGYGDLFTSSEFEDRIAKLRGHLNSNQKAAKEGKMVENGIGFKIIGDAKAVSVSVPKIEKLSEIFNQINQYILEPSNSYILGEVKDMWENLVNNSLVSPSNVCAVGDGGYRTEVKAASLS